MQFSFCWRMHQHSLMQSWVVLCKLIQDCAPYLQGLLPEKKIFEVHIEKGHKHNAKVVLRGEAGYSEPGIQPGDVIFVLEQKPHKIFKRIQADLVIEKVGCIGWLFASISYRLCCSLIRLQQHSMLLTACAGHVKSQVSDFPSVCF